jgi:signal peptidase I
MIKKFFLTLINIISVMIIAAAVVVLCLVVFTKQGEAPNLGGYTVFRITTGSMRPSYDTDTLILVKKTDPSQIQVGDVISFYSADPALDGAVNTHRVIAIEQDGTEWKYTTQGDANNIPDQYGTDSEALIGKVVASSLALGKLARLVANPLVFIPVILISNLVRTIRLAGKIAKDEEEAAIREAIREIQEKRQKEKENSSDKEQ